jgi:hypothetical protein
MLVTVITVGAEIKIGAYGTFPSHPCDSMFRAPIARDIGMTNSDRSRVINSEVVGSIVSGSVVGSRPRVPLDNYGLFWS